MPLHDKLATALFSCPETLTIGPAVIRYFRISADTASQGYGDPIGNPKGENPLQQGEQSTATHNAEHPGPASPAEGKGNRPEPKQGKGQKMPEDASAKSGGSRSMIAEETGSSPTGGEIKCESLDVFRRAEQFGNANLITAATVTAPKGDGNVEKHNKEFEEGYDRAPKTDAGKNLRE